MRIGRICGEGGGGEAWEQKIAEDNWSFVTTSKCQPTKKKLSFLETNISKQKGNLLLSSFLSSFFCISLYSFISKAIKLLFIFLVPLTII